MDTHKEKFKQIERELAEYERVQKEKVVVPTMASNTHFSVLDTRTESQQTPVALRGSELRDKKKRVIRVKFLVKNVIIYLG